MGWTAAAGHAEQEASEQSLELPEHAVHAVAQTAAPWHGWTAAAGHAEQQAPAAGFEVPVTAVHASGAPATPGTAAAWGVSPDCQLLDGSAASSQLQPELLAEVPGLLVELHA